MRLLLTWIHLYYFRRCLPQHGARPATENQTSRDLPQKMPQIHQRSKYQSKSDLFTLNGAICDFEN